jgi:hypothetical protein
MHGFIGGRWRSRHPRRDGTRTPTGNHQGLSPSDLPAEEQPAAYLTQSLSVSSPACTAARRSDRSDSVRVTGVSPSCVPARTRRASRRWPTHRWTRQLHHIKGHDRGEQGPPEVAYGRHVATTVSGLVSTVVIALPDAPTRLVESWPLGKVQSYLLGALCRGFGSSRQSQSPCSGAIDLPE